MLITKSIYKFHYSFLSTRIIKSIYKFHYSFYSATISKSIYKIYKYYYSFLSATITKSIYATILFPLLCQTNEYLHVLTLISGFEFFHHCSTTFIYLSFKYRGIKRSKYRQIIQSSNATERDVCKFDTFWLKWWN